jgi:hypothetical protein
LGPDGTSKSLGGQADFDWFVSVRRRAEVVLTSGKSYVDETYRAPVNAELAVFSRALTASGSCSWGHAHLREPGSQLH